MTAVLVSYSVFVNLLIFNNKSGFQLHVESNSHLLWFCIAKLCDWFKKLAQLSQPTSSLRQRRTKRQSIPGFSLSATQASNHN